MQRTFTIVTNDFNQVTWREKLLFRVFHGSLPEVFFEGGRKVGRAVEADIKWFGQKIIRQGRTAL
jgi:hypothetical protein